MLYLPSNNGETCQEQLCQHPQCWQTNVRRARDAVRRRNGIKEREAKPWRSRHYSQEKTKVSFDEKVYSLPTLKVVDVTQDLMARPYSAETPSYKNDGHDDSYDDDGDDDGDDTDCPSAPVIQNQKQQTPATMITATPSPTRSRLQCGTSFSTYAPHTTPVSAVMSDGKKPTCVKENNTSTTSEPIEDKRVKKIRFHEIYDYKEVCEDWQETFISSAYLVWCPSSKKKAKRNLRTRSAKTDDRTGGFRNIVDEVLPLPIENTKKKTRSYKCPPTGGQPYSPCRSPLMRHDHYKQPYTSHGEFIMTTTNVEIPDSLVAKKKVLEHKTNSRTKDHQHCELRSRSSTKVLVDISSQLSLNTAGEENNQGGETTQGKELEQVVKQDDDCKKCNIHAKLPVNKQPPESTPRRILPLPSVGVPWGLVPEQHDDHCRNSIPNDVDLGVILEPVVYLPRSARSLAGQDRSCANTYEELQTRSSVNISGLIGNVDHPTSAYRFSPKYVFAPAPTPITPRTRESMRRKTSDIVPHATRSKSLVYEQGGGVPLIRYDDVKSRGRQRSQMMADDHVIQEVQETNRYELEQGVQVNETNGEVLGVRNLDEKSYELESSFRAISPSSRTNIPPDIWAELRGEIMQHDSKTAVVRLSDFNDALAPSRAACSYCESSWKPSATKLPQSFTSKRTYVGPYSQTILPQMPASLTVVPVPSVMRTSISSVKQRDREYHQARAEHPPGIIMPPVPAGSPVPSECLQPSGSPTPDDHSGITEAFINNESQLSLGKLNAVVSEVTSTKEGDIRETGIEEYLVARDVMSDDDVYENGRKLSDVASPTNVPSSENDLICGSDHDSKQSVENQKRATDEVMLSGNSSSVLNEEDKDIFETLSGIVTGNAEHGNVNNEGNDHIMIEGSIERAQLVSVSNSETIVYGTGQSEPHFPSSEIDHQSGSSIKLVDGDMVATSLGLPAYDCEKHDLPPKNCVGEQESSKESLSSLNEIQPETSNESILSKVSSDFQLEPFNVESTLLQPIAIESDLLLLTDSFLDLSFDDENVETAD